MYKELVLQMLDKNHREARHANKSTYPESYMVLGK